VVPETLNSQALPIDATYDAKTGIGKPKKKKKVVEAVLDGGPLHMTLPRKKKVTKN